MLAYYDLNRPATLQCDYSENGIGVALVEEGRPVQFANETFVKGEEDAPIKELHNYLYEQKFTEM